MDPLQSLVGDDGEMCPASVRGGCADRGASTSRQGATRSAISAMTRHLKSDEAAAILGMSPKPLANWRVAGYGLPWGRFGRSVRYDSMKLNHWMEARESRPRNASTQSEREARVIGQQRSAWRRMRAGWR